MPAAAFKRILPDLIAAHGLEFPERNLGAAFDRVRDDLHLAWEAETEAEGSETSMVAELEKVWPALIEKVYEPVKDFAPLLAKLDLTTEPSAMTVDLLGVAGRERDEVCHTQVIASLLNPSRSGDLGVALLRALLKAAGPTPEDWPDDVLRKAIVLAEEQQSVRGRDIRLDVVVRVGEGQNSLLVVIENKVDARDAENQLDGYAEWAAAEAVDERLLVYLTPRGTEPSKLKGKHTWRTMSYSDLAVAWRQVLAQSRSGDPWVETLRLYLATITRHIWGISLKLGLGRAEKLPLLPYLRAATGE
jgi:hypothetical protein